LLRLQSKFRIEPRSLKEEASHIAFGSIRVELVFMVLGQAAGLAASMALKNDLTLHQFKGPQIKAEIK
jgi:hypothetical protein